MTWNYRIIQHDGSSPVYYEVHEVFYDEAGKITSWTSDPIDLTGESKSGIDRTLKQISSDCKQPVLSESELIKLIGE